MPNSANAIATPSENPVAILWDDLLRGRVQLADLPLGDRMVRIDAVRAGIPAQVLTVIAEQMHIANAKLYETIGLPASTAKNKLRLHKTLSQEEGERVLGVARLVSLADRLVRESGAPEGFDAAQWVAGWLDRKLPALGGQRPAEFMDTADGREIVHDLLAQMRSGAYA